MSKTLLVLAASIYQISAIKAAKRLGYRVITTDNVASNPGHALADASFDVDTTDHEALLCLASAERIDGIMAPGTDVAVESAAYVAERLHLPGPGLQAARTLTRKRLFRHFLQRAGLPCPYVLECGPDPNRYAALPGDRSWLVKPNRSSGSKGIFVVRTTRELMSRVPESRDFSIDGKVVVEEFVDGTQHTCEGFMRGGRLQLWLITDRDTVALPHTATKGHRVPTRLAEQRCRDAVASMEQVLRLAGITEGPVDCDFVASSERITLIEITPRLGGNSLSRLFSAALEFDLVRAAVEYACGDPVELPVQRLPKPAAIVLLGAERSGRVGWNSEEARLLALEPWVSGLSFDVPRGERVNAFVNGRHRIGEALVTGQSREDVDCRLLELTQRLSVSVS